jgi:cystathionine gamma-synthase
MTHNEHENDDELGFGTRAVHAGLTPDPTYKSVIPAIHQTSTYAQPAPGEFVEDFDYARSANPTRFALETALGSLEGGRAVAFSSGLAAEHGLLTVVAGAGAHVILPIDLYGGTFRLVDKVLARWGLDYSLVDQTDPAALAAAISPATKLIWVETPTNPRPPRPWSPSTTRSPRRSISGRWSSVRTSSCTRPPSTSAATPTWSAAWW